MVNVLVLYTSSIYKTSTFNIQIKLAKSYINRVVYKTKPF